MANVYVYQGVHDFVPPGYPTLKFKKGQYIFDISTWDATQFSTYVNGGRKTFTIISGVNNKMYPITSCNETIYGSVNNHPASGGCMYSIRRKTKLRYGSSAQTLSAAVLNAGDIVIIGPAPPHGTAKGAENFIRMWGYKRGGRSGADIETSQFWVESAYEMSLPTDYTINTV